MQTLGETALHKAVVNATSKTLPIVDFLIQNMSSHGLNEVTGSPLSSDMIGRNSALHLAVIHDQVECLKLLLRSGVDTTLRNSQNKTAMDIAEEIGHHSCQDLLQNAVNRQKSYFDNIDIDWVLLHDDGSTDFSEDETICDDRVCT